MTSQATAVPPKESRLTPGQAAALIGVHLATVYRWLDDGTLPFWLVGKRRRIVDRADVEAMVKPGEPKRAKTHQSSNRAQERAADRWARDVLEKRGLGKYLN